MILLAPPFELSYFATADSPTAPYNRECDTMLRFVDAQLDVVTRRSLVHASAL
jgi:hypothetical protein